MNKKEILSKCYICGKQFKTSRACSSHVMNGHKEYQSKEKQAEYFRKYITPLILKYDLQDKWGKYGVTGRCEYCGKFTIFYNFYKGFKKYCSQECMNNNMKIIRNKIKNTNLKKYGVDNYAKTQEFKDKIKNTNLKRYGVEHYSKTQEFKDKTKATNMKKYGVTSYTKTQECKDKSKAIYLKKYGVEHPSKTQEFQNKRKQTCLQKYGVDHPHKLNKIQEKYKQRCLQKYGVEHYSQTQEYKDKFKETNLKKYGVDHYGKTQECQNKMKTTCLKRYGVDNYAKTQECKDKMKDTYLKKYGVDHYAKTKECQDKMKQTNLKRYGVDNYAKTQEYRDKAKEKHLKKYGVDNYAKTQECKDKTKETHLKKYGVEHYSKTQEYKDKVKFTNLKKFGTDSYSKLQSQETFERTKNILKENNYEFVSRENGLNNKNFNSTYTLKHTKCNKTFTVSYHTIAQYYIKENKLGYMCPHCNPKNVSLKELELQNFIKSHYNGTIVTSDRTILKDNQELDIYIPEYNFAIEFNGMYWHSEQAGKDKNYHLNKTIECEKQNIHLMHIFEDEWDNHKAIIKYKILNKLHLIKNRIHARKCKVIIMSSKYDKNLARKFLDMHHIQGRDNSSIYYGLMYQDSVVAIMSFSKSRRNIFGDRSNNNNIELVRFASHLKYSIPGAASKLFKHFERDNPNTTIISYAHRRLTNINNNLYLKLGFTLNKTSLPGYYYYDGVKRYHRYNFRKSVLVEKGYDPNMTEFEITHNIMGLLRIWDCGQLVYIKNNNE